MRRSPASVARPKLSRRTFESIREALYDYSGFYLPDRKRGAFAERLMPRLLYHRVKDFRQYSLLLENAATRGQQLPAAVNLVARGETGFFAGAGQIDDLVGVVLPRLAKAGKGTVADPVRMWCASCGTGEEAYSIATSVLEARDRIGQVHSEIIASDPSAEKLRRAEAGLYSASALRGTSPEQAERWFTRRGAHYRTRDRIRDLIEFRLVDLHGESGFPQDLHVIFCRNALIELSPRAKARVVAGFHQALAPGGALFVGERESLGSASGNFKHAILHGSMAYLKR